MNRTLTQSAAGVLPSRATIVLAAALVIPNILAATASADATYSGTLQASLTVSGFLDAERNPISKPEGLILENLFSFFDDSFVFIEGDATADADGAIDVIAEDPFDLVVGDRIEFSNIVSGTTIYPTGFSYAGATGFSAIQMINESPDPVTIAFDFDYDYAVSTSVDDPAREYAFAIVGYEATLGEPIPGPAGPEELPPLFEFFAQVENNQSHAKMGAGSFEVTLSAGQMEFLSAVTYVVGDPAGTVPEPAPLMLAALAAAMLSNAARRRRWSDG